MHLRGTGTFRPITEVVFVALAVGISECELLAEAIAAAERDQPGRPVPVPPARDGRPGRAGRRARRGLRGPGRLLGAASTSTAFTLFSHGGEGPWRPRRDFPLGGLRRYATAVHGYGRPREPDRSGVRRRRGADHAPVRRRSRYFDHLCRALLRYDEVLGGRLAAAIAYYGFFAVFALLLIGYSIFGFLLKTNTELFDVVAATSCGRTCRSSTCQADPGQRPDRRHRRHRRPDLHRHRLGRGDPLLAAADLAAQRAARLHRRPAGARPAGADRHPAAARRSRSARGLRPGDAAGLAGRRARGVLRRRSACS